LKNITGNGAYGNRIGKEGVQMFWLGCDGVAQDDLILGGGKRGKQAKQAEHNKQNKASFKHVYVLLKRSLHYRKRGDFSALLKDRQTMRSLIE
jgi:hypothetical protein